jgi:muramoyltetrapeptide carboxypeptidase LdcA involved in peptidoglycan recycling
MTYGRDVVTYPDKPRPGDRVAVVSPSAGLPAEFPQVYERGLRRLREDIGLEPVEYPTTRVLGAAPRDRARDLCAAFADPTITAVLATIGGDDQVTVLPHLDDAVLRANPKPFFGFSDNTCLLNHLYGLGMVAFHGGSVMVHLGRAEGLHPESTASLRAALFDPGWYELRPTEEFADETGDWNDPSLLPRTEPAAGWTWSGPPDAVVLGPAWGGNIEVLSWLLMADRVGPVAEGVLFVETSEELPSAVEVYRILRSIGERGLLGRFGAVLVGRAKAWDIDRRNPPDVKAAYVADQREAVTRAVTEYAPNAVLVFDLDIGHTDPQLIVPYGGDVRVDAPARKITVRY